MNAWQRVGTGVESFVVGYGSTFRRRGPNLREHGALAWSGAVVGYGGYLLAGSAVYSGLANLSRGRYARGVLQLLAGAGLFAGNIALIGRARNYYDQRFGARTPQEAAAAAQAGPQATAQAAAGAAAAAGQTTNPAGAAAAANASAAAVAGAAASPAAQAGAASPAARSVLAAVASPFVRAGQQLGGVGAGAAWVAGDLASTVWNNLRDYAAEAASATSRAASAVWDAARSGAAAAWGAASGLWSGLTSRFRSPAAEAIDQSVVAASMVPPVQRAVRGGTATGGAPRYRLGAHEIIGPEPDRSGGGVIVGNHMIIPAGGGMGGMQTHGGGSGVVDLGRYRIYVGPTSSPAAEAARVASQATGGVVDVGRYRVMV